MIPILRVFSKGYFGVGRGLVLSIFMKTKFKNRRFSKILNKHLFFSAYKISDDKLLNKLLNLVELHQDWNDLIKKDQPNINKGFLEVLSRNFKDWVDVLIYRFPGIIMLIKKSAKETEQAMAKV